MKKTFTPKLFIGIIILMILIVACKSYSTTDKETITIEQLTVDYPVSFIKNRDDNKIFRIFFRIPFEVVSKTNKYYSINSIDYYYNNHYSRSHLANRRSGWLNIIVYNSTTNKLLGSSNDLKDREFNKNNPAYIYIYKT